MKKISTLVGCRIFALLISLFSISNTIYAQSENTKTLHELNVLLINTVMQDVFTPPVASRIYAYPNIAYYTCMRLVNPEYPSLYGKLNGFPVIDEIASMKDKQYAAIAAALSFSKVAGKLVGSEEKFTTWSAHYLDSVKAVLPVSCFDHCNLIADKIATAIIKWSSEDMYGGTRAMPRFQNSGTPGSWELTPADYAPAIEPHWNKMRSFTLDSASQFSPKRKLVYSPAKNSIFYKNVLDVYDIATNLDTTKKAIAKYWDDNPNVSVNLGHLNYFIHKISPGGHWMMITKQACEKENTSLQKSSLAYTLVSIAMYDAFIASWDEKFKTNLIRPITIINQTIDKNWEPYIQTPPFPEFTSGHAVISNSAATVLTKLFGKHFSFTDYTEIPFGNSSRSFKSFYEASEEVTWSRVYGGIHYPATAVISIQQGRTIGRYVFQKMKAGKFIH